MNNATGMNKENGFKSLLGSFSLQFSVERIRGLLLSDLRHYVVSFTYTIPELLHPGKYLAI